MPPPGDGADQPRPERELADILRGGTEYLGEIEIEDVGVVLDIAPLPPRGSIVPSAFRSGLEQREKRQMRKLTTAERLAYGVLGIFGITIVFLLVWGWRAGAQDPTKATASVSDVMDFGTFILPFQVTALGVALGFYFAGRSEE